jgi:hypothetical protein
MLSLIMVNVIILNIAMLNVVILNVTNDAFMPSVVIHDVWPWRHLSFLLTFQTAG